MKSFLMFIGWATFVVCMWKYVFIPIIHGLFEVIQ
jgi:hypothetical protein